MSILWQGGAMTRRQRGVLPVDQTYVGEREPVPEALLVSAIIRQVAEDLRHPRPNSRHNGSAPTVADQLASLEWALDADRVAALVDLIGLDPALVQRELLRAVGLSDAPPRPAPARPPR